jgi:hypothetical protein
VRERVDHATAIDTGVDVACFDIAGYGAVARTPSVMYRIVIGCTG